jgi:hypothetical protein
MGLKCKLLEFSPVEYQQRERVYGINGKIRLWHYENWTIFWIKLLKNGAGTQILVQVSHMDINNSCTAVYGIYGRAHLCPCAN